MVFSSLREKLSDSVEVLFLAFTMRLYRLIDFFQTIRFYYGHPTFRRVDTQLIFAYLFDNPYTLSRRFLQWKGEKEVYAYGETPLRTLDLIAKRAKFQSSDTVFELGSGRGRSCFWLRCFIGCQVVGIEYIPQFVGTAQRIAAQAQMTGVEFRCEDFLESDFSSATALYLYGSNLSDEVMEKLAKKMSRLPPETKIVTVSSSLTEYAPHLFKVIDTFEADFLWGKAEVFIHTCCPNNSAR